MKRFLILALAAVAVAGMVAADVADARRLGGGRSFGSQRSIPYSAPRATPSPAPSTPSGAASNPVMPAQPGTTYGRPAAPSPSAAAPAAPARSGMSRWLAPIAGIAAGLGLAALLSHFGLSEAFASFLLIALIVVAAIVLLRVAFGRRREASPQTAGAPFGAASYEPGAPPSAGGPRFEPTFGRAPAAASDRYPPGFAPEPFLRQAKQQFNRLQEAYDKGDRKLLADVMTPEMYAEVSRDLEARGAHVPTDVVALDAEIAEVRTEGDRHWASVRFHGLLREDGVLQPQPFDEVWNLVKPVDGSSGWLLAGIQQLETSTST